MEPKNFNVVDNIDKLNTIGLTLRNADKLINEEYERIRSTYDKNSLKTAFDLSESIHDTITKFCSHIEFLAMCSIYDNK